MQQRDTETERVGAVLQDLVEDSGWPLKDIEGESRDAVGAWSNTGNKEGGTENKGQLDEFILRVAENVVARKVNLWETQKKIHKPLKRL